MTAAAAPASDSRPSPEAEEVDLTWLVDRGRRLESWALRHRLSRDRIVLLVGSVVALVIAVWLTSGAWGGRPISGDDSMVHVVRARFALRHLVTHGRVDGWDPNFIVGYQEFLFIGAGFTWVVDLLHVLSLGMLSITGAVKTVSIASFVVAPLTVAFLARSFGLSGRTAGVAAVLSLAVNNPFGGAGLQGMFSIGLLPHQLGALFFFLTLGGTIRVLRGDRWRWIPFTAVVTAALLLTHGISVIIFVAMLGVVVVTSSLPLPSLEAWRDRRAAIIGRAVNAELHRLGLTDEAAAEVPVPPIGGTPDRPTFEALRNLAVAFAVAGALAACALLPFWAHRNLRGIYSAWGTPPLGDRLAEIWRGDIVYQPGVTRLVLLGMVYGVVRAVKGKRYALPLVATPLLYVAGSHAAFTRWPASVITPQLTNRAIGYAGVLAILPLAALIARATRRLGLLGDGLAVAMATAIVLIPVTPYRPFAKQSAEPIPQLREAARQLGRLVPDGARFVTQRDFPDEIARTKVFNPDRWLAWASGRYTLNNFNVESSQTPEPAYEGEHLLDRPPDTVADAVSKLGVTHVVTVSDEGAAYLAASPRFSPVWRAPPIVIYSVVPPVGQPSPDALLSGNAPVRATLVRSEPEHLAIDVQSDNATSATVAVGWSPKWHARLDGHPLALAKSPEGLLALTLPGGSHRLRLDFRLDAWDVAGILITLSTTGLGGAWLIRAWRRRRAPSVVEPPPLTPAEASR